MTDLRHFLAAIAYRFVRAVDAAPDDFGDFAPGQGARTPSEVVRHMTEVLRYARLFAAGDAFVPAEPLDWAAERQRFHDELARVDAALAAWAPDDDTPQRLLQGPLGDVMTHVGQIAMLRRLAGDPVAGENYFAADVQIGRLGPDQAAAKTKRG